MSGGEAVLTICGLTLITLLTRSFFLLSSRELVLPDHANLRGSRYYH